MTDLPKKLTVLGAVAAVVVALDQLTKAWVLATFALYESRPVIPGFFRLTYLRNPGAAFSFLADQAASFRLPFFFAVTAIALVVIVVVVVRLPPGRKWLLTALSLVFGGAVGNLIDRVRLGEVVDFLDFFWRTHHWPPFNVADSAITVGVAVLLATELFTKDEG
ncbi:MAG: lipoprotein signal peptidase [Deltaproteobacteria bacterium]|nr:lipoprotein signal peptidase [Deltaproteobacteria bacterium]